MTRSWRTPLNSNGIENVFIYPGNVYVNRKRFIATTILGPCVSVCLWDKRLRYGGINHFMLPFWKGEGLATPKYGNVSNKKLFESFLGLGSSKSDLEAKVFGGIESRFEIQALDIGLHNFELAEDMLKTNGIKITAFDVGGQKGRKIIFDSETGKVRVKYLDLNRDTYIRLDRLANVRY